MAKLLKLRRGSTTHHSSFTGAEGEVTVDTDKDTLVVHDGSTAGGHPVAAEDMANVSSASIAGRLATDSLSSDKIAGGALPTDVTVTNANVVSNAAIANSKLADSGVNAGTVGSSTAIPIITVNAKGIVTSTSTTAIDSTTIANGTSNVAVANDGNITATRSGTTRLTVNNTGAAVTGNLDVSSGVDVTGNITVTGTVDGVDIAGLNSNANSFFGNGSGLLTNGVTATTQSQGDNSTKVATTAYTDTAISNLVDSSPAALNTLNELAAAIGDDANFSTTITNSIGTKMPLSGGTFTGNVTTQSIIPDADSSRNIGASSVRFANGYFDTLYGDGSNLTGITSFLSGMIIMYNSTSAPSGWYLCDGNNGTPDLRDRFIVGAGSSYSQGNTGGANSVTLSESQIPSHDHDSSVSVSDPGHNHRLRGGADDADSGSYIAAGDNGSYLPSARMEQATTGISVSVSIHNEGGGGSHENRPPYYALTFIMKA